MELTVLPDHPAGELVADRQPGTVLRHHSGRPWIVGQWAADEVVAVAAGTVRVAVFGPALVTEAALAELVRGVRALPDLDAVARKVPGCYHLVASVDGQVRVQGSLTGARQVFHGTVSGVTVAADRPRRLAALGGFGIDEEALLLGLMAPYGPPWPLNDRTGWRQLTSPPLGHYLRIDPDGTGRTVRWWSAPQPDLALAAGGAELVRDALLDAVDARTSRAAVVSADLSGGLDSSSLCFAATRAGAPLVTTHYESVDAGNDDALWARHCQELLPTGTHLFIPPGARPAVFAELAMPPNPDTEGPLLGSSAVADHLASTVADRGSRYHLQGTGGDELFDATLMCLHALVRKGHWPAARTLRELRAHSRWSLVNTLGSLRRLPPYPRWLADCAARLTAPPDWERAETDWEIAPILPPWATPDAVATARRLLLDAAAEDPQPYSPLPVQHEMLRLLQVGGTMTRGMNGDGARYGVSFEAPFLDDRVVAAVLSLRLEDRIATGGGFKPVLGAALRGIAPDSLLGRTTKGHATAEVFTGLRRHRRELAELCDTSRLARLGLVDTDALRAVVLGSHHSLDPLIALGNTLGCEAWLRSFRSLPTDPVPGPLARTGVSP